MKANLIDLRRSPGRILEAVKKRESVILSRRGKAIAKIVPIDNLPDGKACAHPAFGMWRDVDKTSVSDTVRTLREGRFRDL